MKNLELWREYKRRYDSESLSECDSADIEGYCSRLKVILKREWNPSFHG
jgi:hypothetical protein